MTVHFTWFHERFRVLPANVIEDTVRIYARTYIMMLLSTQLFGDKSVNRVHIRWLRFVANLDDMGSYSLGSAALVWLYRCMCRVTNRHITNLAGPLHLLQSWIFCLFSLLRPTGFDNFSFPLVSRWAAYLPLNNGKDQRVINYRLALDRLTARDIVWEPYSALDVLAVVHPKILTEEHYRLWRAVISLIYFAIIEWHQVDSLVPQLGGGPFLGATFADPRHVEILTEAFQRGSSQAPQRSQLPDMPDNRRVERRHRIGTRDTGREWRWLDDMMQEDDAGGDDGGIDEHRVRQAITRRRGLGAWYPDWWWN
ncbi:hypothetical protein Ahy_A02g009357 [Arachis hypogaea]|uniref:Aminotransferase-like plant mobile domain-containing protein n=1 Tax=Arachis hypogaea TaxID=3818 RepID=A0A445EH05_ARAHY|nr:hypothetical protein Ahy_A02g009357 [Arachis hypogaea]